jgi:hypothetical protein
METVGELKRRLQIRSGLSEKEFEKVRVALLTNCYYGKAEYLDDGESSIRIPSHKILRVHIP